MVFWYFVDLLDRSSSQETELREISISCKNLFLNWCEINTFYSLPEDKILDWSNLKQIADNVLFLKCI